MAKKRKFEFKRTGCTGRVLIEYWETGELGSIKTTLRFKGKKLSNQLLSRMIQSLPVDLKELKSAEEKFAIKELSSREDSKEITDLIATWKYAYKEQFSEQYKLTPKEIGLLKQCKATPEQIKFYMESTEWNMKGKTITEFVRGDVQNCIQRLLSAPKEETSGKYPDHYDSAFEASLTPSEMQLYWKHLRDNGWIMTRVNNIKKWQRKEHNRVSRKVQEVAERFNKV